VLGTATVNGRGNSFTTERLGDGVRPRLSVRGLGAVTRVELLNRPGTQAFVAPSLPGAGERSAGLRLLRARAEPSALGLVLEGRGGRRHALGVRSPRQLVAVQGVTVEKQGASLWSVSVAFDGPRDAYVRREVVLPLR
jgi:hypothetical protein